MATLICCGDSANEQLEYQAYGYSVRFWGHDVSRWCLFKYNLLHSGKLLQEIFRIGSNNNFSGNTFAFCSCMVSHALIQCWNSTKNQSAWRSARECLERNLVAIILLLSFPFVYDSHSLPSISVLHHKLSDWWVDMVHMALDYRDGYLITCILPLPCDTSEKSSPIHKKYSN